MATVPVPPAETATGFLKALGALWDLAKKFFKVGPSVPRETVRIVADNVRMMWNPGATYGDVKGVMVSGHWFVAATTLAPVTVRKAQLVVFRPRLVRRFPFLRLYYRVWAMMFQFRADQSQNSIGGQMDATFFLPGREPKGNFLKATTIFTDHFGNQCALPSTYRRVGDGKDSRFLDD